MKMKQILFSAFFIFLTLGVFGQDEERKADELILRPTWSFASGGMVYFYKQDFGSVSSSSINTLGVLGLRYNFKYLGKNTALSVGSYPGVGLAFLSGFNGSNNTYFSFDLPILLELHTGSAAHPNMPEQKPVGLFLGAGMGINFISKQFFANNPRSGFSYGPTGSGGLKFQFGQRAIIFRGSFLYNFNPDLANLKAIGVLWALGN
jgi:hypothetical protein